MMGWIQIAMLVIQALIKFGPTIYKIGKEVYDWIEERKGKGITLNSDAKATAFNLTAERRIIGKAEVKIPVERLNDLRETVWAIKNPGKEPKPLKDPALRVVQKQGKTAGARSGRA